jgi:hypothetical protein
VTSSKGEDQTFLAIPTAVTHTTDKYMIQTKVGVVCVSGKNNVSFTYIFQLYVPSLPFLITDNSIHSSAFSTSMHAGK